MLAESENLERELALRSARMMREEKREEGTPARQTNYTSISGVRKEYEETIRKLRKENYALKEGLEYEKEKAREKAANEKRLNEELQKTKDELK